MLHTSSVNMFDHNTIVFYSTKTKSIWSKLEMRLEMDFIWAISHVAHEPQNVRLRQHNTIVLDTVQIQEALIAEKKHFLVFFILRNRWAISHSAQGLGSKLSYNTILLYSAKLKGIDRKIFFFYTTYVLIIMLHPDMTTHTQKPSPPCKATLFQHIFNIIRCQCYCTSTQCHSVGNVTDVREEYSRITGLYFPCVMLDNL